MRARDLVQAIRSDLASVEQRLLTHPYLAAVDAGTLPRAQLATFAGEQFHIIRSDLRSVALLVSRFGGGEAREFFLDVLAGERTALGHLLSFGQALGLSERDLEAYEPMPAAHAYTAYMAYLALYGSDAEVAAAYLVNFPAWGASCGRMGRALREQYGLSTEATAFFDFFATPAPGFESAALAVVERKIAAGWPERLIRRAARLLQGYELLYWDALWEAAQ
jgi:pyrroloquinoline quinone (PQQ) biosynthesis protein C